MPIDNYSSNELIESKIKALLIGYFSCDSKAVNIRQLKDGVVNCYNNMNYHITIGNKKYFAKYGNPNGERLGTSLANEIVCRTIASSYGISPPILLYDCEKTIMITEFMDAGEIDLKDPSQKKRYADLLNKLHQSGAEFPLKFCPFQVIQQYVSHAHESGVSLPSALIQEVLPVIAKFQRDEIFLDIAPCHLDPQSSNILDDGTCLYLIDWECAAMSDPLFDLACMCSIEEFSENEMVEILTIYLKKEPSFQDLRRFYQMRILADVRYCTYCYLQTGLSIARRELFKTFAQGFLDQSLEHIQKLNLFKIQ